MRKPLSVVLIVLLAVMPTRAQVQESDKSVESDWRKVVKIEAGTTIRLVTVCVLIVPAGGLAQALLAPASPERFA